MSKFSKELPKIKDEEFDAISFFRKEDGTYSFHVLKFNKTVDDYEKTDLGFKYYMLTLGDNREPIVEEAILGDPLRIVKQWVSGRGEGIFVKKCSAGKTILEKLVFGEDSKKRFEDFANLIRRESTEV